MTRDEAVRLVLMTAGGTAHTNGRYHRDQCVRLAMQWPSLAAALAELMEACETPVPLPFRAAARVLRGEAAELAVQPTENGAWCFCPKGPNVGGRGHLRGEECRGPRAGRPAAQAEAGEVTP